MQDIVKEMKTWETRWMGWIWDIKEKGGQKLPRCSKFEMPHQGPQLKALGLGLKGHPHQFKQVTCLL